MSSSDIFTGYSSEDGEGEITPESKHCAGAMIVLKHMDWPNQMMRIADRIGFYDRTALVMDSPVPESLDAWVELHAGCYAGAVHSSGHQQRT